MDIRVTRPYEWKKLLAAKILFVLAFVNLPLLVLDVCLLKAAGFAPMHYAAGLLWMQLMIAFILLLPAATLATVTATVAQVLLVLLFLVLYLVSMVVIGQQIPSWEFASWDLPTGCLFFVTCVAVVLLQYARRRTLTSRLLIAGLALASLVLLVATPYRTIVARRYPRLEAGKAWPFQLALLPAPAGVVRSNSKVVTISLPFGVSGIEPGSFVRLNGVLVVMESPTGLRWDSGWRRQDDLLFPDHTRTRIDVPLQRKLFESMKSAPVNVSMSLAFTVYWNRNPRPFVVPAGEFALPDAGHCAAMEGYFRYIACRAPMRGPSSLLAATDLSRTTCPLPRNELSAPSGEIARGWIENESSAPAETGISPVKTVNLRLTEWNSSIRRSSPGICPGTPLVLSNPEPVRRARVELIFKALNLSEYQWRQEGFDQTESAY